MQGRLQADAPPGHDVSACSFARPLTDLRLRRLAALHVGARGDQKLQKALRSASAPASSASSARAPATFARIRRTPSQTTSG
eukprot:4012182-Pyramimonas_sp.AAC.1